MEFHKIAAMPHLRRSVAVVALCVAACSNDDGGTAPKPIAECPDPTPLSLALPDYFPDLPNPADNPITVEGVALGRRLFYDPILSGDSTLACGGCHTQLIAFGDFRRFSEGIHGDKGTRQAPTLVNTAWNVNGTFWDGRADDLEEQATKPIPEVTEMALPWPEAIQRLERHPDYPDLFCAAFGSKDITQARVVKAIAQFERTFVSTNSKYDRWKRGEEELSYPEYRGYLLFNREGKGDCFHCHAEPLFSAGTFHNTGLDSIPIDLGRGQITGNPSQIGQFKAPTLRNIMESPPYMHDGRFISIRQALDHYNHGFYDVPNLDSKIRKRLLVPPMSSAELDTLEYFLQTLTDWDFLNNPDLSSPFETTTPVAQRKPLKR